MNDIYIHVETIDNKIYAIPRYMIKARPYDFYWNGDYWRAHLDSHELEFKTNFYGFEVLDISRKHWLSEA